MSEDTPRTSDELARERTDLALDRTVIAAERTLMAWVRTSLSMISFGFTLYKFFQYLREANQIAATRVHGPRHFGLALIGLGTAALIVAALQHRQYLQRLGARQRQFTWSLAFVVAVLVALIGALTFFGMLLRVGPF